MVPQIPPRCECGKLACESRKDAKRLEQSIAKERGHSRPVRFYQCRFGPWHWTTQVEVSRAEVRAMKRQTLTHR